VPLLTRAKVGGQRTASPPAKGSGEHCNSLSWVPGQSSGRQTCILNTEDDLVFFTGGWL